MTREHRNFWWNLSQAAGRESFERSFLYAGIAAVFVGVELPKVRLVSNLVH
jgi:hypothetical protein